MTATELTERLSKASARATKGLGLVLALGVFYGAGPFPFMDQGVRIGGAVCLAVMITALSRPLASAFGRAAAGIRLGLWAIDLALVVGFVYAIYRFFEVYDSLWDGVLILETEAVAVGAFGILVIVEMVRRVFGIVLPIVGLVALLYAYSGDLPGIFGHKGFAISDIVEVVWFSFSGVFGRPTDIVSSIVLIFILFGVVLEATGATNVLLKMATAATARIRGGTAHSAILASAMFGTISGSVVANVVGTGVFTIPMIRKQGFSRSFAGAVEAAASSAGQFTPPIMAAVAFIMAELLGLPYLKIAIAAAIPALFYYFSLFACVYCEAVRLGIEPVPKEERPVITRRDWIEALRFILPLLTVVVVLIAGRTAAMAGFIAILTAIATGLAIDIALPSNRQALKDYPRKLLGALERGGNQCGQIMVAVALIGTVIAVVGLTGLAGNFAALVAEFAQGTLLSALLVTMLACLVLGMGLPTLPAYLFIILFIGPVIERLGVDALLIHMFVLYFGVLSNVTPPVAIAAYAAAPIAGASPMRTGMQAFKIAAVGFIIPFVIIYYPSITLVSGFEAGEFAWLMLRLPLIVWLVATGFIGCDRRPIGMPERSLRMAAALVAVAPILPLQLAGFLVGAAILVLHGTLAKPSVAHPQSQPQKGE